MKSADSEDTIAGGSSNDIGVSSTNSAIGGGENNTIGLASAYVTIAGGHTNDVGTNSTYSAIGGGDHNSIGNNSLSVTIAGGAGNTIDNNSDFSVISGGAGNSSFSSRTVIGGGESNVISLASSSTVIAGGNENTIQVSASYSAIGGGRSNLVDVSATYSCIPGGRENVVDGDYAFAAGRRAKANHNGAFVWGDSTDADIASTNANSVTMRAAGGYRLFTSTGGNGAFLAGGSGSWTSMSDRNSKENFHAIEPLDVLEKVAALKVQTWNYKSQSGGIRHIGPMAQDFYAAFHVGETDTGITTVDADGVALAAIQGLNQNLEQKETEIGELKRELAELKELVGRLTTSQNEGER
jgi:hypothetical protein